MIDFATLEKLLKEHNSTVYRLSKETGIAASTFSDWKSGRSVPKIDKLRKIAAFFDLPLEVLLSHDEVPNDSTLPLSDTRTVSGNGGMKGGLGYVSAPLRPFSKYRTPCLLPIIGEIRAGSPIITDETLLGYEYADVDDGEEFFFLRVRGDSMKNSGILDGSLVLFRKSSYAENGEIVACLVGGDSATVKRFFKRGRRFLLCPENEDYTPIELSSEDFETGDARILGVAVEVRIRL